MNGSIKTEECTSRLQADLDCTCSLSTCRKGVGAQLPVGLRVLRRSRNLSASCRSICFPPYWLYNRCYHLNTSNGSMLKTEETVTIISLDFSQAFYTLKHSTLLKKLSRLDLPDNIYNWMVDFLLDRKHRTRYAGQQTVNASINASVVQ